MFEKILVPVDGSKRAEAVFGRLRSLLASPETEVLILRAAYVFSSLRGVDHRSLLEAREAEAKGYVVKLAEGLRRSGVRARGVVRRQYPAGAILDTAAEEGAGLVAMSSHGSSGLNEWMFGSVAWKVLEASHTPVLVLPSFDALFGRDPVPCGDLEFRPRRILVPTDGSRHSLAVVSAAGEVARRYGAQIVTLFVEELARKGAGVLAGAAVQRSGALAVEEAHDPGADPAVAACDCFVPIRVSATPKRSAGDPALRILEASRSEGADLIAMATHGIGRGHPWPLGSVTQKVLSASHLPMLIVRPYPEPAL